MHKKENIGIVFPDFGPYHVARIDALRQELNNRDFNLIGVRFSESSPTYSWKPALPQGIKIVTLLKKYPNGIWSSLKMALTFLKKIIQLEIRCVYLPSYSPLPNFLCLLCVKLTGCKAILMNESWSGTENSKYLGKSIKKLLVGLFDAALVGGTPQKEYMMRYGLKSSKIFLGYDAVDVAYYKRESRRWKETKDSELPISNLPSRYFLNLGRFVSKKNVTLLIKAYAIFVRNFPSTDIALVLVGEGHEEKNLQKLVKELELPLRDGMDRGYGNAKGPEVVFYPFQQVDLTPLFFAKCECFVLPSIYEEWGLVINEAMSCGVCVLVSNKVGCTRDLIIEGENGFTFDPSDVNALRVLLEQFVDNPYLAKKMGQYGQNHIKDWGPERFATGAISALTSAW